VFYGSRSQYSRSSCLPFSPFPSGEREGPLPAMEGEGPALVIHPVPSPVRLRRADLSKGEVNHFAAASTNLVSMAC